MKKTSINIVNVIGTRLCTEPEDGQKVFELIKKALQEKHKVEISFMNVEILTTAFLNAAIGQLYKDFKEEEIRKYIAVENLSPSGEASLRRVVNTAKLYYRDPGAMERSINEILGE
ncbi:MAG: STAS-like domain-containing protein [Bacteroidota bacterium]|nr:STAS-like domain-containing protein [Bacteroidota bacterium]